jgi:predicted dehydrogenase
MKTIRTAVAGAGFIGPVHIESIRRAVGVEVVALFHPVEKELVAKTESWGIPHGYADFEKMIAEENFDCIHICTPNNLHFPMAKAALLAGKHVVCEKPLATTVEEAKELVSLAKKHNRVHAVNFNLRYYPLVRQMKRMREKGELGNVYSVVGSYLQDWLFYATDYNWRLEPDKSGDSKAIADIGSHLIDLIEYITGLSIVEVMADFSTVHKTRKKPLKPVETYSGKLLAPADYQDVPIATEDYASVLLRFNNGSKGVVTVSQVTAGRKNRCSLEISGANQTLSWNSENPNDLWIGKRNEPNAVMMRDPAFVDPEVRNIISYPGGHNEGFGDTSKQLFKEIYDAVRANTAPVNPSYPTFEDGLRELILCDKIVESHRAQAWVTV